MAKNKKKKIIKIDPNNYWDTCNVVVRYEYGGQWHSQPPPGRYTKIKIDWYKDEDWGMMNNFRANTDPSYV